MDFNLSYWRTNTGLEVDFIISDTTTTAIEVKISNEIKKSDIKGLIAFAREHPEAKNIVVCSVPRAKVKIYDEIEVLILPITSFLKKLWNKELF